MFDMAFAKMLETIFGNCLDIVYSTPIYWTMFFCNQNHTFSKFDKYKAFRRAVVINGQGFLELWSHKDSPFSAFGLWPVFLDSEIAKYISNAWYFEIKLEILREKIYLVRSFWFSFWNDNELHCTDSHLQSNISKDVEFQIDLWLAPITSILVLLCLGLKEFLLIYFPLKVCFL